MNIDIEEVKHKALNHLCMLGRSSTKSNIIIYELGQAIEQQQEEIERIKTSLVCREEHIKVLKSDIEELQQQVEQSLTMKLKGES